MNAYRELPVDPADLRASVIAAADANEPLGAYASDDFVRYLFCDAHGVLALRTPRAEPAAPLAAAAGDVPLFDWDEREMRDTRGVALRGLPNARALFIEGDAVPPALTAEGKGVTVIVVGPVHAGIIEPGRFTFSSGGETVIHLDAQLSYSRRGVERFLEGNVALEAAPRVARICGACSAARSWTYARALEGLAGAVCDERSDWARVAAAELERLYNHVFDLASSAAGAGYGYGQIRGLALKERIHRVCAALTGHRLLFDAIVPGGVRAGTFTDVASVHAELRRLRVDAAGFIGELTGNRSVLRRFTGAGILLAEVATAFGATGPARRASGGSVDLRRFAAYGAYAAAPPAMYHESAGDVAARCRVKASEIDASFALVERALTELGAHAPPEPLRLDIGAGAVTVAGEGPRGAETVSVECDARGRLVRVHVISAAYRNWPVVLRAMEGNIVPDFPLVNKSFNLCYACADR